MKCQIDLVVSLFTSMDNFKSITNITAREKSVNLLLSKTNESRYFVNGYVPSNRLKFRISTLRWIFCWRVKPI